MRQPGHSRRQTAGVSWDEGSRQDPPGRAASGPQRRFLMTKVGISHFTIQNYQLRGFFFFPQPVPISPKRSYLILVSKRFSLPLSLSQVVFT